MSLKRLRREKKKQPITSKWVPTSPEGDIGTIPKRDLNNNSPRIITETIFPPETSGILRGITSPHPTSQAEAKAKHVTGFILRF
ncbi:hypothetical protein PUN28_020625 [Cardiocondyla obscurior]|uniref:Uncharacterized protein n=1 Tax=Cardiocondyla obscurior TaxID=286306 RepID=A0AAW2E8R4_9HYME